MQFSELNFVKDMVIEPKESEKICITYECRKDELMNLPVGDYKVVLDLKDDNVLVTNCRLKKGWRLLTYICVNKDTKKARTDAAREVMWEVAALDKVCKGTVAKTYGKDIADKAPVWQYVDNPYYKCASDMQLYLVDSIEHLYGKKQWVGKRK